MTFSVKNKFVSLGGGSFVEDDNGNRLFKVKGKMFSPTRKKILCDINGKKTVRNPQQILAFFPQVRVYL